MAHDYANDQAALDEALARCANSPDVRNDLGRCAYSFLQGKRYEDALKIYDTILDYADLGLEHLVNALWAVQRDNTGLPVDAKRSRRYLAAALPHGPRNPTLYVNAAGVYAELAEHETAIAQLLAAAAHGVDLRPFLDEPLFAPLRKRPEWAAVARAAGRDVETPVAAEAVGEVPEWASVFSGEEYGQFVALVTRVLDERSIAFLKDRFALGDIDVPIGGGKAKRFSVLAHAARKCHEAKREHWKGLITEILRPVGPSSAPATLAPALKSIEMGDLAAAVAPLYGAWQRTRSPRVAELLDRICEAIGKRPGYSGDWIEQALRERTREVGDLVDHCTLIQIMRGKEYWITKDLWDPRATRALLAILEHPPTLDVRKRIEEAYQFIIKTLVALGDTRAIEPLAALAGRYQTIMPTRIGKRLAGELDQAARELAEQTAPKPLSAGDEQACERMERCLGAEDHLAGAKRRAAEEGEFVARIARDLADDRARLDYAEWLERQGDSRGEFIKLQIRRARGDASPAQARREAELFAEGHRRWLGELADVIFVDGTRWERGFPFAFSLAKVEQSELRTVLDHPGWSTAVEVSFYEWLGYNAKSFIELLSRPGFEQARRLNGVSSAAVVALTRDRPRAFEMVELDKFLRADDAPALMAALERLPALEMLRVRLLDPRELAPLCEPTLAARLGRLVLRWEDQAAEWYAAADDSPFRAVEFSNRNQWHANQFLGFKLRFTRAARRLSVLEVSHSVVFDFWPQKKEFDVRVLLRQLDKLPADALTSFTLVRSPESPVQPSQKDLDALRAALARFNKLHQVRL